MTYEVEVSRNNVTLSAFFSAVKAACKKKGSECNVIREEFEKPIAEYNISYHVKDGIKYWSENNGRTIEYDATDAPNKSETYRIKPLDFQTYILNFDGSMFNEICEFTFDDDKRGHGYYYQANRDKGA